MIDFKNNDLWNKEKLHQTIRYIKDNCILKQVTSQYQLHFDYGVYKDYNTIKVIDRKTNKDYKFTSFKNLVSYFYWYVLK